MISRQLWKLTNNDDDIVDSDGDTRSGRLRSGIWYFLSPEQGLIRSCSVQLTNEATYRYSVYPIVVLAAGLDGLCSKQYSATCELHFHVSYPEKMLMLRIMMFLVILGFASSTVADTSMPATNCNAPEYRQLDFWLGDWDTFDTDNPADLIARTHVNVIVAGCAVHELYEQTDGLIGDSILSYDAVRKAWQQTWVTNRGSFMAIAGQFKDGSLMLEGEVHLKDGKMSLQRITWKVEGSDVRESSVISKDEGKTWQPGFDVLFRKHH